MCWLASDQRECQALCTGNGKALAGGNIKDCKTVGYFLLGSLMSWRYHATHFSRFPWRFTSWTSRSFAEERLRIGAGWIWRVCAISVLPANKSRDCVKACQARDCAWRAWLLLLRYYWHPKASLMRLHCRHRWDADKPLKGACEQLCSAKRSWRPSA